ARASVARSSTTRCSHGRCGLLAPAGLEPGSGWSTTTPPGLPAGIAAAKPPGQWCATHRIPDIDTGSFRPRLSRFSSFCRHTLHIAADCKHPSDTKLKTLGAPRIFGTIASHRLHPGHTFLPITRIRKLIYTKNSEEPTKHELRALQGAVPGTHGYRNQKPDDRVGSEEYRNVQGRHTVVHHAWRLRRNESHVDL